MEVQTFLNSISPTHLEGAIIKCHYEEQDTISLTGFNLYQLIFRIKENPIVVLYKQKQLNQSQRAKEHRQHQRKP